MAETKYIIPNLQNACRALDLLGERSEGLTVSKASRLLEIPQTTALRIFSTLEVENFVHKVGRIYHLGPAITRLQIQKTQQFDLVESAMPAMQQLARAADETAHIAIPSGFKTLLIGVCESPHPIRASSRPGTLADAYCSATGKVFVAHLFADRLEDYAAATRFEARTSQTHTDVSSLSEELPAIRKQGYAVDDEEYVEGVRCLAAPIFNQQDHVIASVGITAGTQRFPRKRITDIAKLVKTAAAAISETVTI
ncbi:IclR family transcriptional regulator [Coraliomargarita akajimensis]|uniref:Transcriptional regulator, IclR family n=1 Tax=Coraliomargarita akajimensis (strain DSM 45221 / IAM 15411 / JCM 23193 / KCTC 12865 / 04OKA010-24) TaxID=583355 RepID=D5EQ70_CORAD|nr:IclR family transcriptional regulator [Coraliomargarita akajimensis]ADE53838.1 transcriptional regulator, IclR family [Coraliomargarita akajimensis DSM 45221]